MRVTESESPYAVVRRLLLGDPNSQEEWFRVVTWSPDSAGRELIGWCRTFEAACHAAWDHKCAYESWRHYNAAHRVDATKAAGERPPAAEMLRFYRESKKAG